MRKTHIFAQSVITETISVRVIYLRTCVLVNKVAESSDNTLKRSAQKPRWQRTISWLNSAYYCRKFIKYVAQLYSR